MYDRTQLQYVSWYAYFYNICVCDEYAFFFQFLSVRLALFATIVQVPMKPGYEASLDQEDGTADINL